MYNLYIYDKLHNMSINDIFKEVLVKMCGTRRLGLDDKPRLEEVTKELVAHSKDAFLNYKGSAFNSEKVAFSMWSEMLASAFLGVGEAMKSTNPETSKWLIFAGLEVQSTMLHLVETGILS